MAATRARFSEWCDRLRAWGETVPPRVEAFHRERLALLADLEAVLSGSLLGTLRQGLGLGSSRGDLARRMATLDGCAPDLPALCDRITRVEGELAQAARTLGQVAAPRLGQPDGIPAQLARLGGQVQPLGRAVRGDAALRAEQDRCAQVAAATAPLAEALALWLRAESLLGSGRGLMGTGPLASALPGLQARLCEDGPTPAWRADLQALVEPLEQLAGGALAGEVGELERILRVLPRWARVLDLPEADGAVLSERWRTGRKDWHGVMDPAFRVVLDQARALEQSVLAQAAARRRAALETLTAPYARFARLVEPDAAVAGQLTALAEERPVDPRDHEDWWVLLGEAESALGARVKRAEGALLEQLAAALADCRGQLAALEETPGLAERGLALARCRDAWEGLAAGPATGEALALLQRVADAQGLLTEVLDLGRLMAADQAALAGARAALEAVAPEGLGPADRAERESLLARLRLSGAGPGSGAGSGQDAAAPGLADTAALREACASAGQLCLRLAAAARGLGERREGLRERLRRLGAAGLRGECPDLERRVEALIHPPALTCWPAGAEAGQVQEAERLLGLLERQALRLAARDLETCQRALEARLRRGGDAAVGALVARLQALPPEAPPPADLRREAADLVRRLGLDQPLTRGPR